jgi:hypothetical protein
MDEEQIKAIGEFHLSLSQIKLWCVFFNDIPDNPTTWELYSIFGSRESAIAFVELDEATPRSHYLAIEMDLFYNHEIVDRIVMQINNTRN